MVKIVADYQFVTNVITSCSNHGVIKDRTSPTERSLFQ